MKHGRSAVERDVPEHEVAERVEEGKNAQDSIILGKGEHLRDGLHIRVDAEVRQHHAFRLAGAAAAEDDGGEVIHGHALGLSAGRFQKTERSQYSEGCGGEFVPRADGGADVLQPENGGAFREFEFGLLDKLTAGDDGAQVRLADGRFQPGFAHGVVEVDAGAARECGGDCRQRSCHGRRQQQAHSLLALPVGFQGACQGDRPDQGLERRHVGFRRIGHCETEGMPPHGADEGLVQRAPGRFPQLPGSFPEFADEAAEFVRRRLGGNRSPERNGDRIRNTLRPFGDESPPDKTENAAPDAIQVNR